MTSVKNTSSYSSEEDYDEIYEDQYAAQIGKSVKCKQFINNVVATRGQAKPKQVQAKPKQVQAKPKQVEAKPKQKQPQTTQELPQNKVREVVDDWEDLV